MSESFVFLARGLGVTLQVVAGGAVVAFVVAVLAGLAARSPLRRLRWLALGYIEVFRGTSALVQLYWVFYVVPQLLGLQLGAMTVGVAVLGLHIGAYGAEVVRGAVAGVPRGQVEAAIALGLSPLHQLWRIVLPQAVAIMLPLMGNLLIELLKVSALVSFITLHDVMWAAGVLRGRQPEAGLRLYVEVMLLFGVVALMLGLMVRQLEKPRVLRALSRGLWWLGEALHAGGQWSLAVAARWPGLAGGWHGVRALPWPWLGGRRFQAALAGGLTLAVAGWLSVEMGRRWDMALTVDVVLPALAQGLWVTVLATVIAAALALTVGAAVAVGRRLRVVGLPLTWGMEAIRCTPLLAQLFLVFYGLLPALGLRLDPLWVGAALLGLHYSAYTAEAYRAGIDAVPRGQWEAAKALGLGSWQTMGRVVLPQALPRVVPALGNYVVAMFKETPLLSTITVVELLARAEQVQAEHFRGLEALTLVGVCFLILSLLAAWLIRLAERWLPVRHG